MISRLHEPAAFQPTHNIDAFNLAQPYHTFLLLATHLLSFVKVQ